MLKTQSFFLPPPPLSLKWLYISKLESRFCSGFGSLLSFAKASLCAGRMLYFTIQRLEFQPQFISVLEGVYTL